jgi:type III secretion protein T
MNEYTGLFLNSPFAQFEFESLFCLFVLTLSRILPILLLVPFFGAKVLPHPVKMALAICLFAIFLPLLIQVTTTPLAFNLELLVLMVKEFFIGYILGLLISIPFSIFQSAGIIIDNQRGSASLMVNDPTMQNQSSPLGLIFNQVFIVVFFAIGGPFYFIESIGISYQVVPPDRLLSEKFFVSEQGFWQGVFHLFNQMMNLTIQMASPALIAILMTDLFLGIINRLAPQVQITFLGMGIKSLLALMVVWMGWTDFTEEMVTQAYNYQLLIREFIREMTVGVTP